MSRAAHDVPLGYKWTEVGVIPEEWKVVALRECLVRSPDYGINAPAVPYSLSLPTYIRITDISEDCRFAPESLVSVDSPNAAHYFLEEGNLVFARTGASVGKSYLYDLNDGPLVFAGFLIRVKPDSGRLLPAYLAQYVKTAPYWSWVRLMSMRSGQPGINGNEYGRLSIPLPPLPEQRAIAAALADVDELLAGLDAQIAKQRAVKTAAMQRLLSGRTRLPGFGGAWETRRFGDIALPRRERNNPSKLRTYDFCVELEHIEQGTGRLSGSTSATSQSSLKSTFEIGDVLFGKLRAYLRKYWHADRQGVCSTEIWVLVPNYQVVLSEFLFQIVQVDEFIEAASMAYGTHMPRSDWNVIKNLEVVVPPLGEQRAIAAVLSDMDAAIAGLEAQRAKTAQLKQGMMQQLLTGRVRLV